MSRSDAETRLGDGRRDARPELRLWLRLLATANLIEREIRRRLAERFDTTLPRFDLMAQLYKAGDGMILGDLSRRMMVSNGNVTGLVDRLVSDGQVEREAHPRDRRATVVRLTPAGRRAFAAMAAEHEAWVAEAFAGLQPGDTAALMSGLARLKASVRRAA